MFNMNSKSYSPPSDVHRWNISAGAPQAAAAPIEVSAPRAPEDSRTQLRVSVSICAIGPAPISAAAFQLLRRLPRVDSLREAASGLGYSYRHAWALIRSAEDALGSALIATQRGRGMQLTPYGALIAAALDEIESRLASELDAASQALGAALALGRSRAQLDARQSSPASQSARPRKRRRS
jgi:molybdate transport repressor ModE-like protein